MLVLFRFIYELVARRANLQKLQTIVGVAFRHRTQTEKSLALEPLAARSVGI